MKKYSRSFIYFIILLVSLALAPAASADETLNNASIIELQGLNLGDAVIIEKIKTSKSDFDTSINGLKQLKAASVSAPVIQAMLATKSSTPGTPVFATAANSNDPLALHPGGVWVLQGKAMSRIEYLRPIMGTKSSGYNPWTGSTYEQFVYLPGTKSKMELSERRPVFYFYFVTGQQLSTEGGSYEFMNAQSPDEFMLTRFHIKDGERQLSISKGNAWSYSHGVSQSVRGFEAEKVAEGIYKVSVKKDLANGEYAFSSANGQGYGQCFPFGISSTDPWNIDKTITDPEVQRLCDVLKTGKPNEVINALKSLREMDAPEAVPDILTCLTSSNSNVIRDACRTLAVLGDKSIVPSIEPLLKHSRADVRKDAQDAIDALSAN